MGGGETQGYFSRLKIWKDPVPLTNPSFLSLWTLYFYKQGRHLLAVKGKRSWTILMKYTV